MLRVSAIVLSYNERQTIERALRWMHIHPDDMAPIAMPSTAGDFTMGGRTQGDHHHRLIKSLANHDEPVFSSRLERALRVLRETRDQAERESTAAFWEPHVATTDPQLLRTIVPDPSVMAEARGQAVDDLNAALAILEQAAVLADDVPSLDDIPDLDVV